MIFLQIEGAHLQCINIHYAKFEYKAMKTVGLTGFTNQTVPMHFGWKTCLKPRSYAQYTPRCKYTPGVQICTWGVFWSCKRCFMKMHPVQICTLVLICSTFVGGANSVEQISTRVQICTGVQIAHMNAVCYDICTI